MRQKVVNKIAFLALILSASPAKAGTQLRSQDMPQSKAVNISTTTRIADGEFSVDDSSFSVTGGRVGIGKFPEAGFSLDVATHSRIAGVIDFGSKSLIEIRNLSCPELPCRAVSNVVPYDVFSATAAAVAGAWMNQRTGTGP